MPPSYHPVKDSFVLHHSFEGDKFQFPLFKAPLTICERVDYPNIFQLWHKIGITWSQLLISSFKAQYWETWQVVLLCFDWSQETHFSFCLHLQHNDCPINEADVHNLWTWKFATNKNRANKLWTLTNIVKDDDYTLVWVGLMLIEFENWTHY